MISISMYYVEKESEVIKKMEATGQYGTNVASVLGCVRLRHPRSNNFHGEFLVDECRPQAGSSTDTIETAKSSKDITKTA